VAEYQKAARRAITEINERGHLPILVGGSGLYVRAAIDPLEFQAEEPGSRRRTELEELGRQDPDALILKLKEVDPEALEQVDTDNPRRVIRAIEAAERTGKPFSARYEQWHLRESVYDAFMVGLMIPRDQLIARIESRVDRMISDGLLDEAKRLTAGDELSQTAAQALGYKELFAYLRGDQEQAAAIELIKIRTRQFAKRQMTWFKADQRVNWIDVSKSDPETAAERIIALVNQRQLILD
jgi:tRNA dimethylallyltransferase